MVLQENVPLLPRHAVTRGVLVSFGIEHRDRLAAATCVDARIDRVADQSQDLIVAGRDPLHVAPIAAVGHYGQLKRFFPQMQVETLDARKTLEVIQDFLDGALHALVGVLLAQR
jgi:hypothetical protein